MYEFGGGGRGGLPGSAHTPRHIFFELAPSPREQGQVVIQSGSNIKGSHQRRKVDLSTGFC